MEKVIECPICYDQDSCFEDTQEKFKSYMCFNCGFMSSSYYIEGSEHKIQNSSQLIKDLKYFDEEREIYWYPSVVNMGKLGIIYPEGNNYDWTWKFASVVEVTASEKESYPIPGKEGEFYTERLDVDNAMEFGQYDFLLACQSMGIVGNNLQETKPLAES